MSNFAIIQTCSCSSIGINLLAVQRLIDDAVQSGANIILLPDHFALYAKKGCEYDLNKEVIGDGRIQNFLQKLSKQFGIYIIASGIPIVTEYHDTSYYLATIVYDSLGSIIDVYYHLPTKDNIHIGNTNSSQQIYGDTAKIISTPYANIGIISSYDLYNPELFRYLKINGADIFALSAAINAKSGMKIWKPLLQARAIENNTVVIAANQSGFHHGLGLLSHGQSCIINQDGSTYANIDRGEGVLIYNFTKPADDFLNISNIFEIKYRK